MIEQLKAYTNVIIAVIALLGAGYTHFKAFEYGESRIQAKFDTYKGEHHDLIQKAATEKARVEKEQYDKYKLAETGYSGAISVLNDRLRDTENLSRGGRMPVAGAGGINGAVSEASAYSLQSFARLKTYQGTAEFNFYSDAMKDNEQCQRLIELVR